MNSFDWTKALFLAQASRLSYEQLKGDGTFKVPNGYQLVKGFKAKLFNKREWFGYVMESKDSIIVSFRGTMSLNDLGADMELFQVPHWFYPYEGLVHAGYQTIYASVRENIFRILSQLSPAKTIYVTGHSLGGAIAILHAYDLAASKKFQRVMMYNFGSPMVGDPIFTQTFNQTVINSYRIVNEYDVIPRINPQRTYDPYTNQVWFYSHVKEKVAIKIWRGPKIRSNHSIDTYIKGIREIVK